MQHSRSPILWALTLILTLTACESAESEAKAMNDNKVDLTTEIQKGSYLLGYGQAEQLMKQTAGVVDGAAFAAGVADFIASADSQVPQEQMQILIGAIQQAVTAKQQEAAGEADAEAKAFREAFAAQEGVTTLPSGLMYEVLTEGEGPKPTAADTVVTHYHGMLTDGTVFDSSVDRGEPATFPVGGVIKGWTEALQLMGVGSKWKLVIPSDLAYGERGAGGAIGPNETLVFEVELLEIK